MAETPEKTSAPPSPAVYMLCIGVGCAPRGGNEFARVWMALQSATIGFHAAALAAGSALSGSTAPRVGRRRPVRQKPPHLPPPRRVSMARFFTLQKYNMLSGVHLLNHSVKRTANPTGSEIGRIKPRQHSGISFGPTESVKQVG